MGNLTTIQITSEEDSALARLKQDLKLPSKKAVVLKGLEMLARGLEESRRRERIAKASAKVRQASMKANLEWAPHSMAAEKDS